MYGYVEKVTYTITNEISLMIIYFIALEYNNYVHETITQCCVHSFGDQAHEM